MPIRQQLMNGRRDLTFSVQMLYQSKPISTEIVHYSPYGGGYAIPQMIVLPPNHPYHAANHFVATVTFGSHDGYMPGWHPLRARIQINSYHSHERPGLIMVEEPTADPSCLIHFPAPEQDKWPGIITLAIRRYQ